MGLSKNIYRAQCHLLIRSTLDASVEILEIEVVCSIKLSDVFCVFFSKKEIILDCVKNKKMTTNKGLMNNILALILNFNNITPKQARAKLSQAALVKDKIKPMNKIKTKKLLIRFLRFY